MERAHQPTHTHTHTAHKGQLKPIVPLLLALAEQSKANGMRITAACACLSLSFFDLHTLSQYIVNAQFREKSRRHVIAAIRDILFPGMRETAQVSKTVD